MNTYRSSTNWNSETNNKSYTFCGDFDIQLCKVVYNDNLLVSMKPIKYLL